MTLKMAVLIILAVCGSVAAKTTGVDTGSIQAKTVQSEAAVKAQSEAEQRKIQEEREFKALFDAKLNKCIVEGECPEMTYPEEED